MENHRAGDSTLMIAIAICIIGLLIYLLAKDKPAEAGKWMFIIGLAFSLWFFGKSLL